MILRNGKDTAINEEVMGMTIGKMVMTMKKVIGLSDEEAYEEVVNILRGNRFCVNMTIGEEQWKAMREIIGVDGQEMLYTMHGDDYGSCQLGMDRYIIDTSYQACYYSVGKLEKYEGMIWKQPWAMKTSDTYEHDTVIEDEDGFDIDATRRYIDGKDVWVNQFYPFQIVA